MENTPKNGIHENLACFYIFGLNTLLYFQTTDVSKRFHVHNILIFQENFEINKIYMYCKNAKVDDFIFRLSNLLSDDWKKDKKQEWKSSDFSDCAKLRYKVIFPFSSEN